ncbi:MAG: GNAT family N-acetyltransferase [Anaerolineae bacterium]
MAVTVHKVESKQDHKDFFEFPWQLYQHDPNWVPPLLSMQRDKLNKQKNPSWQYLRGDYYLARRDGRVVGTIAAFVNPRHNEFHKENIAWFGLFEVENDPEAAHALLKTAEDWARAEGYTALRGPQSFTATDEVGLLVEGFTQPVILMPYNPPYYQGLVESAGFQKVMDVYSYHGNWQDLRDSGILDRFGRLVEKTKKRHNITIRPIDRKNLKAEFNLFKDIYNAAWELNWGFTPFTEAELDALVEGLGMIFDPKLACFAYVGNEPVGFLLSVPDFNVVLKKAYPNPRTPEVITLVKALWHWKIRPKTTLLRIPLMGVKAAYRGKGVDMAMYHHTVQALEGTPYTEVDAGWILETNQPMNLVSESSGLEVYKRHRFYEKALS